jgi:hypothetical protein
MSKTLRHVFEALPVTLTVVSGPLIAMVYHLTHPQDAAPGRFSLAQITRGALCVLLFAPLVLSRRLPVLTNRLVRPLLFLALCAVLTAPAAPHARENLVFAVKLIFLVLVFGNAFHLAADRQDGGGWLTACAWVLLLMMASSTGAGLATGRVFAAYGSRYATGGLIGQPMEASTLLLSALPVFISLLPRCRSALAGLWLLSASVFFTMCRSSLIAGGAATGCAFLINLATRQRRLQQRTVVAFLGILLVQLGLGLGTGAGADLVKRFQDLHPGRGTGSGRYAFWEISGDHIRERPLHTQVLGEGMGSIREVMEEQFGAPIGSHNDWLDFVNNLGLCGLAGICWWYGGLVRFAWRLRGRRDGPFQGVCAVTLMLALISTGTGGFFEPCWTLCYAALGFWAGGAAHPSVGPAADPV